MNHCLRRLTGMFAALVCMAFMAVPSFAGDPQVISASPVLPPGANQVVCDQIQKFATYSSQQTVATHVNIRIQPTSFSSCVTGLITDAQKLNNIFANGFSFSAMFQVALQSATSSLLNQIEQQACKEVNGVFKSVNNGIIAQTSISNIMGRALPGQLSAAISVKPGPTGCPGDHPVSINGHCVTQATAATNPTEDELDNDDDDAQPDDLDQVANSMGSTITAAEDGSISGLDQGDDAVDGTDNNTAPIPPPKTYQMPANIGAPNNATICFPPDPRNDLPRDIVTVGADDSTYSAIVGDTADDDSLDNDNPATKLTPAPNPIVPRTDTPNHGDPTPTTGALNPGGIDTVGAGCTPYGNPSSAPGMIPSSGTSCTANTKLSCMAGAAGCDAQNGGIGYAKDYQSSNIFSHGPYSDAGKNPGACASLTKALVPQIGHTGTWRKGAQVYNNSKLQFGTGIATFFGPAPSITSIKGQPTVPLTHAGNPIYEYQPCPACNESAKTKDGMTAQHTGIFLGYTKKCMFILEEWTGSNPHVRCMDWGHQWNGSIDNAKASENAAINYYVVTH